MTKQQAKIAAVVLDYLPMASPETAAEMSKKILETLEKDQQRKTQGKNDRTAEGAYSH